MNKATTQPYNVQSVSTAPIERRDRQNNPAQPAPSAVKPKSGNPVDPKKTEQQQKSPPARKKDLVELHNRIVQMMTTLNEGLTESARQKAAQDRAELCRRIDEMQFALNQMEGALRIELAPLMRDIVKEEMRSHVRKEKPSLFSGFLKFFLILSVIVLGAYFSGEIVQVTNSILEHVSNVQEKLVPLWGHLTNRESI